MKRMIYRWLTLSVAAFVGSGLLCSPPVQAVDDVSINLVAVNDFHGQIDDKVVQWAATVQQLLADGPSGNSLLLSAGDNVGESSPASRAQHDNPAIDVLNLLGVDASAVGNHEFDRGYDDLINRIMARAEFPILGSNVKKLDGSNALEPSETYTMSGVKVAVIGAVTEDTPNLVEPSGIADLTFVDPVDAINAEVDRLQSLPAEEQPDVVIAVIHEGAPWGSWTLADGMQGSSAFASLVEDTSAAVDAIIMGHTHNTYVYDAPVPGEPGRTRPLIQTGFHGKNVGQIKLTIDGETREVEAYTARNVERSTASDGDLIPTSPTLATIAEIRDEAVAFAAEQAEAAVVAQQDYDDAVAASEQAHAAATSARTDYEASVETRQEAFATASALKDEYEAAVSAGQQAYAAAEVIKQDYLKDVKAGQEAYAAASVVAQAYAAAVSEGQAAYTRAAAIKDDYVAAITAGREAYAAAAQVRDAYLAEIQAGKDAYAQAALVKQAYLEATAEGKAAYTQAAEIKQQYLDLMAQGDPDAGPTLEALSAQYTDAIAEGDAAYARASAMSPDYTGAIAAGDAAYARASAMVPDYLDAKAEGDAAYAQASAMSPDYRSAIAAGDAAYARASAMTQDYLDAKAEGDAAYAQASAMTQDYLDAKAEGDAAYAQASAITPAYQAAVATLNEANATTAALKQVLDEAVAALDAALATAAELKERLLNLLDLL